MNPLTPKQCDTYIKISQKYHTRSKIINWFNDTIRYPLCDMIPFIPIPGIISILPLLYITPNPLTTTISVSFFTFTLILTLLVYKTQNTNSKYLNTKLELIDFLKYLNNECNKLIKYNTNIKPDNIKILKEIILNIHQIHDHIYSNYFRDPQILYDLIYNLHYLDVCIKNQHTFNKDQLIKIRDSIYIANDHLINDYNTNQKLYYEQLITSNNTIIKENQLPIKFNISNNISKLPLEYVERNHK